MGLATNHIMKNRFYTILVVLVVLSCGFVRKIDLVQEHSSISKAVALIKQHMNRDSQDTINVVIINSHNGRYTITSSLWNGPDSVKISTHTIDMTGRERDTIINLEKKNFLFKLDRASYPINSVKFAGHHQRISIKRNGLSEAFETVDGRALMNLFAYGE
jgi:hypothetical protein